MSLFVLCIGAHPDDNEYSVGGTAALFRKRGDSVKFISVTNGNKGHFAPEYVGNSGLLARRREMEARRAAEVIGAEYATMGISDGEVYVTPDATEEMVRVIRSFGPPGHGPDLVLLNRPNDYHRDHRYTAHLVLDATYMLTVPPMCSNTRHLDRMPVFAYWNDTFTEGGLFRADVVVPIDSVLETKIDMLMAHESQFFEWLPFNLGETDFPTDSAARRARIAEKHARRADSRKERYPDKVPPGASFVEAFQISEYGRQPTPEELRILFPVV